MEAFGFVVVKMATFFHSEVYCCIEVVKAMWARGRLATLNCCGVTIVHPFVVVEVFVLEIADLYSEYEAEEMDCFGPIEVVDPASSLMLAYFLF